MLPPYIPQPGHRTTTGSLLRRPRRHIAAAPVAYFLSGAYKRPRRVVGMDAQAHPGLLGGSGDGFQEIAEGLAQDVRADPGIAGQRRAEHLERIAFLRAWQAGDDGAGQPL